MEWTMISILLEILPIMSPKKISLWTPWLSDKPSSWLPISNSAWPRNKNKKESINLSSGLNLKNALMFASVVYSKKVFLEGRRREPQLLLNLSAILQCSYLINLHQGSILLLPLSSCLIWNTLHRRKAKTSSWPFINRVTRFINFLINYFWWSKEDSSIRDPYQTVLPISFKTLVSLAPLSSTLQSSSWPLCIMKINLTKNVIHTIFKPILNKTLLLLNNKSEKKEKKRF